MIKPLLLASTMLLVATPAAAQNFGPAAADQMTRRGDISPDAGPPPLPPGVTMPGGPGGRGGPGGPSGPPPGAPDANTKYTAVVRVVDGAYSAAQSSSALGHATQSGDTASRGLVITSGQPNLNGVLVSGGQSAFTLADAKLTMSGTGTSDFLGIGAGAMVTGGGIMVLRHVTIDMSGAVRSATVANDHSIMKIYDSTITAHGGPLPADYKPHIGPGMMEAPPPLGITGTARANLTMGQSETYLYDSTIKADGWGALSTDATGGYVYLEANDCDVTVLNSGYGAYADGGAHVRVNKSRVNVATYGAIAAGSGEVRFTDVTGHAGRNLMMIHSVMGSTSEVGRFWMTGGKFETGQTAVLVKSANAEVSFDHAVVHSGTGVLVQGIVNDDSNRTKVNGQPVAGIKVTLSDGDYTGNLVMQDNERGMTVTLTKATLRGAIRNAMLVLDGQSQWTATGDATVTLQGGDFSHIDATTGVTIHAAGVQGSHKLASGGMLVGTGA